MKDEPLRVEGLLLESRVAMSKTASTMRERCWKGRVQSLPTTGGVHKRCRFLFDHGTNEEAERALRAMIAPDPADAKSHHNLGR